MTHPFKYETHVHCSPASACALLEPERVVELYAQAGYSGMFLTDHFFNGNCGIPYDLPWKERVRQFCDCFRRAERRGAEFDFRVFFAYEFNFCGAEFLVLNSTEQFLYDHPDLLGWGLEEFLDRVRENGAFVVHAHPYRAASYIPNAGRRFQRHIDAVEVFNASHNPAFNPPAAAYAKECGLYAFSGSDNHDAYELQYAGLAFRTNPATSDELLFLVKAGDYVLLT
ncbi:MAG: PHP domain-containing protein [Kiritimatiellaeota bacterium]|nr:PHP domain-containing protein [Kiritimatiellota bacterium]